MDPILEVKNLKISFRTGGGKLQAVRDISFSLKSGKTLAIVGESGSGKSVTSKAMMGILAGNAIVEGGEILYEGQDLLRLDEKAMYKIRGDKLAMIFQNPLSSLNPIVKIGKQITEAMRLKNKAARKNGKRECAAMLRRLKQAMQAVDPTGGKEIHRLLRAWTRQSKGLPSAEGADWEARFQAKVMDALRYSHARSMEQKRGMVDELKKAKAIFTQGAVDPHEASALGRSLCEAVDATIDRLHPSQEGSAESFRRAMESSRTDERLRGIDWLIEKYEDEAKEEKNIDFHQRFAEWKRRFQEQAMQAQRVLTRSMAKTRAIGLMTEVGISEPAKRFDQYPFEFSGGMRQRIVIAIALAADPAILICDEPTTALDVTIQAQILELINQLKRERNLSILFITHDLGVVANMADEIAVMYAGKIVEYGSTEEIFYDPRHPYTWALLASMPDLETNEKLESIPGTPPNLIDPPRGDAFAPRNRYALQIDFERQPPAFEVSPTHWAATWLLHPDAPKVELPSILLGRIERMRSQGGEANG